MPNIDAFKSAIAGHGGLAKSNMFQVMLPSIPDVDMTPSELNLFAKNVTLPGRQIATNERQIGTKMEKMAYGHIVDDVSITFLVTNSYNVKKYFDAWQNLTFDQDTYELNFKSPSHRSFSGFNTYGKTVIIKQMTLEDNDTFTLNFLRNTKTSPDFILKYQPEFDKNTIYSVQLEEAFPTSVNAIELTNEQDGLVELTVQLSYTNWRTL